ncbi:Uncharacterized protein HZ326_29006 [Fusarium oxysporum f. sp. albedinis]|nr:Uncharacterized protein HZ326_29006 [Fusarium oxysporum f. sp. albedinis]
MSFLLVVARNRRPKIRHHCKRDFEYPPLPCLQHQAKNCCNVPQSHGRLRNTCRIIRTRCSHHFEIDWVDQNHIKQMVGQLALGMHTKPQSI